MMGKGYVTHTEVKLLSGSNNTSSNSCVTKVTVVLLEAV